MTGDPQRLQTLLDEAEVNSAIAGLAEAMAESLRAAGPLHLVGIHSRGAELAARLAPMLAVRGVELAAAGSVDIALYRDDYDRVGLPVLRGTELPFVIEGARIVLVDDILFTGRTIRAALQALAEYGRPQWVKLAVFADRGLRELPIQADFAAYRIKTEPEQRLALRLAERDGRTALELEG